MSRTTQTFKGKKYPAKTRKKLVDKKSMGFTSGLHSQFEKVKALLKKQFEETDPASPFYPTIKRHWERIKDKTYPKKGVDYVKYGYGKGIKKENKIKNHEKFKKDETE